MYIPHSPVPVDRRKEILVKFVTSCISLQYHNQCRVQKMCTVIPIQPWQDHSFVFQFTQIKLISLTLNLCIRGFSLLAMTLKSGNCQAAEALEQPLRLENKRWLASLVDTIQCGRKLWIQYQKYQNLLLNHNSKRCTLNDDVLYVFCVWMFWGSFELAQVWPSSDKELSKMYKYKNITEAK